MPFIEEKNLVDLHKLIEKSEKNLDLVANELKVKSGKLEKEHFTKKILSFLVVILFLGLVYAFFFYPRSYVAEQSIAQTTQTEYQEPVDNVTSNTIDVPEGVIYRVQIGAFEKFDIQNLEKLQSTLVSKVKSNGKYKYSVGSFSTYAEAHSLKTDLIELGFKDSFIAATNNGENIHISEALKLSHESEGV